MIDERRYIVSAVIVAAYAFVMYAAAGFFFSSYNELIATCSRYSVTDCAANDSLVVSIVSLKIGVGVFFLMGTFAWAVASYLGLRWWKLNNVRLP
jgi:Flp pilus assembly CpaE family ATPase